MPILPQNYSREQDQLQTNAEECNGRVDRVDTMHQRASHPTDLWQREAHPTPQRVAAATVEDAKLRGDNAAHSCDCNEDIFDEDEVELPLVVIAPRNGLEEEADEPGKVDRNFAKFATFGSGGRDKEGDKDGS